MKKIDFHNRKIKYKSTSFSVEFPIASAFYFKSKILVIYEYMAGPRDKYFENFVAFDLTGNPIWKAELPNKDNAASYVDFLESKFPNPFSNSVWAYTYNCFSCEIDAKTGKILKSEFTK